MSSLRVWIPWSCPPGGLPLATLALGHRVFVRYRERDEGIMGLHRATTRRTARTPALWFVALAVAGVLLGGCTPPIDRADEPVVAQPTEAIIMVADEWGVVSALVPRGTPVQRWGGNDTRVLAVDLSTGAQRVLYSDSTTSSIAPPARLSPDGDSLLIGTPNNDPRYGERRSWDLLLVDVSTSAHSEVIPGPVASFGWDGSDIIVTTAEPQTLLRGLPIGAPALNSVLRVSPSEVTTLLAGGQERPESGYTGREQLRYVGSHDRDLYFDQYADLGLQGGASLRVDFGHPEILWKLPAEGPLEVVMSVEGVPRRVFDGYIQKSFITDGFKEGLLGISVVRYVSTHDVGGVFVIGASPTSTVEVWGMDTMERLNSFELTAGVEGQTDPPIGLGRTRTQKIISPRFDSWLALRELDSSETTPSIWVCETEVLTGKTTPLLQVDALSSASQIIVGALGPDRDVVFTSEWTTTERLQRPGQVMLWSRTTGEASRILQIEPWPNEYTRVHTTVGLLGTR